MSKNLKKSQVSHAPVHNAPVSLASVTRDKPSIVVTDEQRQYVDMYRITGLELMSILEEFGASQAEFGKIINRTGAWVSLLVNAKFRRIPYRYAQKLQEFVGVELYVTTLADLRKKHIKRVAQEVEGVKP